MKNWRRHGINLDKSGKTIIINSVMDISNKKSPCYTQHTQGMTGQFILILWWEDCITIHCGPAHLRGVELRFGLNTATPSSANWAAASPLLSSTLSSASVWGGPCRLSPWCCSLLPCCFGKWPLRFCPPENYSLLGKTTFLQHCICRGTVGELFETWKANCLPPMPISLFAAQYSCGAQLLLILGTLAERLECVPLLYFLREILFFPNS